MIFSLIALRATAAAFALALPLTSLAVSLGADGLGQGLIYPYFTVQSTDGNAFNTYLSVSNHDNTGKVLRVRLREGRMGKEALGFNLYLAHGDTWTGAVIPTETGARLISRDRSCTEPGFSTDNGGATYLDLNGAAFSGTNSDGAGSGLDRTREGYVEVLEMATVTYPAPTTITPGVFQDCAQVIRLAPTVAQGPTGRLSGSLTAINVANGLAFTLPAQALADLSSRSYYRPASESYPDFSAAEIDPTSVVVHNGAVYRSTWQRPEEAVSAVLMATSLSSDFVLDRATASATDIVVALPTRRMYGRTGPFSETQTWSPDCGQSSGTGEGIGLAWTDREARRTPYDMQFCELLCAPSSSPNVICAAAGVAPIRRGTSPGVSTSDVVGSRTLGLLKGEVLLDDSAENGRIDVFPVSVAAMITGTVSQPNSTRTDIATGQVTTARHRFYGSPMIGAGFITYRNGTLRCGTQFCQGNYGSASPMRAQRLVEVIPN